MYDTSFIDELASAAPAPGGGGASAYAGALAAALASMVGNLTVGKKTYADVEDEVRASLDRLDALRAHLIALVDEDARAFEPLAAAYRLPKATPEEQAAKNAALQQALVGASDVPLAIMRAVAEVVDEADYLAHHGSKMARSDAGVAARSPARLPTARASTCSSTPPRWMTQPRPRAIAARPSRWPRARASAATSCSTS